MRIYSDGPPGDVAETYATLMGATQIAGRGRVHGIPTVGHEPIATDLAAQWLPGEFAGAHVGGIPMHEFAGLDRVGLLYSPPVNADADAFVVAPGYRLPRGIPQGSIIIKGPGLNVFLAETHMMLRTLKPRAIVVSWLAEARVINHIAPCITLFGDMDRPKAKEQQAAVAVYEKAADYWMHANPAKGLTHYAPNERSKELALAHGIPCTTNPIVLTNCATIIAYWMSPDILRHIPRGAKIQARNPLLIGVNDL